MPKLKLLEDIRAAREAAKASPELVQSANRAISRLDLIVDVALIALAAIAVAVVAHIAGWDKTRGE